MKRYCSHPLKYLKNPTRLADLARIFDILPLALCSADPRAAMRWRRFSGRLLITGRIL